MTIESEAQPPTMPGAFLTDPKARAEHESKLRDHFAGRTSAADPHGNLAAFDQEMRSGGMQRADTPPSGEVDQRALDFLNAWRAKNPHATTAQLTLYERDLASVLEGRRMGETPAQFAARKASAAPAASPATPTADDAPVYVQPSEVPASVLHDYALPELPAGVTVDPASLDVHLSAARAAGITQEQVAHVVRLLASQAAQAK